ncbi:MAG TPA: stage V sporulation protein E [Syntrophomonadaceae bacterium]|nr:stage V sporulation protein E [Syntrophomonadaceae bacterium]
MKQRKQAPDFILFLVVLFLLTLGIIMVFSSSYVYAQIHYGDGAHFLKNQLAWALLGIAGMVTVMKIDYSNFKRWAIPIFGASVFLLLLVLIPGVGITIKGSTRWLGVGPLTFQPSEVAKLAMVIFLAKFLSGHHNRIKQFFRGFVPPLLVVGIVCGLILAQPDLGTAVTIAGTAYFMILAAGARKTHLITLALVGVGLVILAAVVEPYRMERLTAFLNPWADPLDTGFQTIQSLYAVGSGGLLGMGLGQGRQKFLYLPEQHTDFIFAVLCEELGFIGAFFVLLLFFAFMWRGLRIALKAPDNFGALLAVGITGMVVVQAVINMGVVTGSLPVTGITLPFISYGGSSLTLNLLGIGILLNISHYGTE